MWNKIVYYDHRNYPKQVKIKSINFTCKLFKINFKKTGKAIEVSTLITKCNINEINFLYLKNEHFFFNDW